MKKRKKVETQAMHEQIALDNWAAYELVDSENFEDRQKARNILRYQTRGYCFELAPKCSRWGSHCLHCCYLKCRENEQYDGVKWDYDFDPDVDRFSALKDNLLALTASSSPEALAVRNTPPKIDVNRSLNSLLVSLAERSKSAIF